MDGLKRRRPAASTAVRHAWSGTLEAVQSPTVYPPIVDTMATTNVISANAFDSNMASITTPQPQPAAAAPAKQIPIVCPGHTRPLAELQFCLTSTSSSTSSTSTTSANNNSNNNNNDASPPLLLLMSACHDRVPMVRNGTTGDWMGSLVGHKGAVWCCRMDRATLSFIATASGDFSCRIYDAITGTCLFTFTDAKHILKTCDFNPISTTLLATAGHEGIVRIYDLVEQERRFFSKVAGEANQNVKPYEIRVQPLSDSTSMAKITIGKLDWYNDSIVLIGCSDGTVRFYNIPLQSSSSSSSSLTTPNSNSNDNDNDSVAPLHVISTTDCLKNNQTQTMVNCEIRDMEVKQITPPTTTTTTAPYLALSIAAGNTIFIFDITDLQNVQCKVQHTLTKINFYNEGGLSLHPTGTKFIVGGSDLYVYLYRITDDNHSPNDAAVVTEMDCYKGHHGPIRCLRYSPSGTTFASGSEDGTIRLWQQP